MQILYTHALPHPLLVIYAKCRVYKPRSMSVRRCVGHFTLRTLCPLRSISIQSTLYASKAAVSHTGLSSLPRNSRMFQVHAAGGQASITRCAMVTAEQLRYPLLVHQAIKNRRERLAQNKYQNRARASCTSRPSQKRCQTKPPRHVATMATPRCRRHGVRLVSSSSPSLIV